MPLSAETAASPLSISTTGPVLRPYANRQARILHNLFIERLKNMLVHETRQKKSSVKTAIPGPKSKQIFDFEQQYISPGTQTIATLSQLVMEKGDGCIVEDIDGNRYIDFFAGVAVASLGYNHPKYVKMMQEQVAKIHVGSFTTKV